LTVELKSAIKINNIPKSETECSGNLDRECAKCNVLSSQLQETITELKSTQFIFKLLKDDFNKLGDFCDLIRSDEQNTSENTGNEWKVVNGKHFMKSKKCSSYLRYQDILTTNRYGVLSETQIQFDETPVNIPVKISDLTS
jgi:hypothetical protein